jgi:D-amino-acid dehydrogenase
MKICVLGSGVLGVTTAYELAKRGHEVTVIDRQPEAARECSFANGGQLSYAHAEPWANPGVFPKLWKWMFQEDAPLVLRPSADPHMIRWGILFLRNCLPSYARRHSEVMLRLGLYSKKKMADLLAETKVEFHHLSKGILHVYSDQPSFDHAKKQAEYQHSLGCEENVLTREQAFALEPTLANTTMNVVGGIHAPIDESGDIHLFTKNLAALCAEKYNVKFLYGRSVRRIHKSGGAISHIELEGEKPEFLSGFDRYVMSMGSHSSVYLRQVGLYVPIYPMKGYSISFDASEFCPSVSITDDAAKQVYSLLGNRMRVAGTAEFDRYNEAVRPVRIAPLIKGMQKLFPKAPLENLTEWACLRPSTPDGPPIIGGTPLSNLFVNSGHGTLGWTQCAGSARLLADTLEGRPTEIPMSGLDVERCLIRI